MSSDTVLESLGVSASRTHRSAELERGATSLKRDFAAGASASLKKTSKAIMCFLEDKKNQPRQGLRDFLHERLGDLAVKWYRHGFNRGHKESHKHCKHGEVPGTLRYDATREFFTNAERTVHLKSTLRKKRPKR
jgi:hypothetical protein